MSSSPDPLELVSVPDAYEIANRIIAGETCYLVTYLDREFNKIIHLPYRSHTEVFNLMKSYTTGKCKRYCNFSVIPEYVMEYEGENQLREVFISDPAIKNLIEKGYSIQQDLFKEQYS